MGWQGKAARFGSVLVALFLASSAFAWFTDQVADEFTGLRGRPSGSFREPGELWRRHRVTATSGSLRRVRA
jgi:hypothetical protein